MGLPNMVQLAQVEAATEAGDYEGHISKSQLWVLICAADRLLGMFLNISPISSRHGLATTHSVSIGGIVQNQVYLCHLTDIASKIQHLDHLNTLHGSSKEVRTFALTLSGELNVLASQTPDIWWSGGVHGVHGVQGVNPAHIVQFLHYYVAIRVHLPLALRQGPDGGNIFSCLACVDACESLVQRYQYLSRRLPPGLFLSEMLDLQVFTAAATLLVISHMSTSIHFLDIGVDKIKISNEVGQVIKLLHQKSRGTPGSGIAHDGVATLSSLNDMLRDTENGVYLRQIPFHVPLLGTVHVRRNAHSSQANNPWAFQLPSELGLFGTNEQFPPLSLNANMSMEPSFDA